MSALNEQLAEAAAAVSELGTAKPNSADGTRLFLARLAVSQLQERMASIAAGAPDPNTKIMATVPLAKKPGG